MDMLVEIERPIGLKFFELWDELENLLGCQVELVRDKLLREDIRDCRNDNINNLSGVELFAVTQDFTYPQLY